MLCLVIQWCPTLHDRMVCTPPGSSVHGISQARILEWVSISFSSGSSWPGNWTGVSCIAGGFFTSWATREAQTVWVKECSLRPQVFVECVCVYVCVCFPRQSLHPRNTVGKILKKDFFSWFIFLFFLFVCFIFNWRIVALQHCVGFCQISSWISHRYTYVPSLLTIPPPPSPSLPSRLLQSWETQTIEKSVSNHFR